MDDLIGLLFEFFIEKFSYFIDTLTRNKGLRILSHAFIFVLLLLIMFGVIMLIALIERELF